MLTFKSLMRRGAKEGEDNQESGFSLIEVLVGFTLIVIVLSMGAIAITQALGVQQNTERSARGTQLARDYIEKMQGSKWDYQGFHESDDGYAERTIYPGLTTVTIPEDIRTTGIHPIERRSIAGVEYIVKTDVLVDDPTNEYATHTIRVVVEYNDEKGNLKRISVDALRTPTPSERIPTGVDDSYIPGADGRPGAPRMSDNVSKISGFVYSPGNRVEISVYVPTPGDYPVTKLAYNVRCANGEEFTLGGSSITNTRIGDLWIGTVAHNASFKCQLYTNGTEIDVTAINSVGEGAPLTLIPENFTKIGQ